jgi:nucleotide-binding universal stress UspA family protein
MKKILLALDGSAGSKKCMDMCAEMAGLYKASVGLLHVIPILDENIHYGLPESGLSPALEAEAQIILKEAQAFFKKKNIKTSIMIEHGIAGSVIIEKSHDFGLVIVGSQGKSGMEKLFLGSTSEHVVQNCAKPVLVVK